MKHSLFIAFFLCLGSFASAQQLTSPDGNLSLEFMEQADGVPAYRLDYKGKPVLTSGRLGLLTEEADLTRGFKQTNLERASVDNYWNPVWGEYNRVRNHYNEMTVTLEQPETGRILNIRFRLFDDGLGFRYELPLQRNMNYLTVKDELTEFNLTGNHKAFCIPGDYDTNEFAYTTAPISEIAADMERRIARKSYESKAEGGLTVQTPLMLKSEDGVYLNIHEAALVDYAGMLLNVDDKHYKLSAHLTPDKLGKKGYLQLPVLSPWRTVIVSDDARDILASQLIYNLNEPCRYEDTSWIRPMKFVGVWWEMFTGEGKTWAYSDFYQAKPGITDYEKLKPNGHHPANTAHVKEYIDFASAHGIDGILVEGWNEGWEDWASYRKDRQFLFTKPYPDFDVKELQRYAKEKGVQMVMHHETAANAADYERLRQVALGVLQFGIYAGCNYPAFVCKGRCANGAEQQGACACIAGEKILCRGKVVHQHVRGADKADYYANNSHEPERYKLYHGGGSLNLAGKLGGDCVHEVRAAHIEHHQRNALRPYHAAAFGRGDYEREIGPAGRDENEGIARAEPAENAGESGVINGAHEPAHIVAVLAAYRGLGIVNYAVHLNVFLRHHGERQYAYQHYNAADYPRQYAQRKVTVGLLQYGLRLKEYARAYNDAYYHADSHK